MDFERIVLVTRKTRLEELVERFNTRPQARFYIEHSGGDFDRYELEHNTYHAAVDSLRRRLAKLARLQTIERLFLPNYLFTETDLVVTVGVDGLVVNTAKYLNSQPLVAVNPDPAHIDGVLLPFGVETAEPAVRAVLDGQAHARHISMAQAQLNDGQSLLAFNDLFIGVRSHTSTRYRIQIGDRQEFQSSSGIIISTGAGSTGWLSSLFNMAVGMLSSFGAREETLVRPVLDWDAERLIFVVREPFASKSSGASIVCGEITPQSTLRIESLNPDGGVIFSDGIEADYLAFNAGAQAAIGLAKRKTRLVVP
jgi:NAD kinase